MVAPSIFCSSNTNQIGMGDNTRFVFHRKPCLNVTNRLNSLKHMQHFDAHDSNQKKEKEKKKEENIQCTSFRNACNITKTFELARGTFTDIEHDYN